MISAHSLKLAIIASLFVPLAHSAPALAGTDLFSGEPASAVKSLESASSKASGTAVAATAQIRLATRSGDAPDEWFGRTIANLGDVNGDGKADFAIGLPLANLRNSRRGNQGEVALYISGVTDFFTPAFRLPGKDSEEMYGWSITGLGDFNNDGFDDFAVGAPSSAPQDGLPGRVEIFYGGNPFTPAVDLNLRGERKGDRFGFSLDGGKDVNGDGIPDLIVGAKFATVLNSKPGKAYVYFGGNTPDAVADLVLSGSSNGDEFGGSVDLAGDIDGDGANDLLVGASRAKKKTGAVYVYRGGVALDAIADATMVGSATDSLFGRSIDGSGRINNDSFADVLIAAPDDVVSGSKSGKVYVYTGGPGPSLTLSAVLSAATSSSFFGFPVKWFPDLNGDTFSEIAVGAPLATSSGGFSEQGVFSLHQSGAALTVPAVEIVGYATREAFATDFALIGDATGDARLELLVGAPLAEITNPEDDNDGQDDEAGIVSLFSLDLPSSKTSYPAFELSARWFDGAGSFGVSSKAGDYDGNGIVDQRDLLLMLRLPRR